MNSDHQEAAQDRLTLGKVILIGMLVLSLGGGSAYAGSKVGAKKLKTITVRTSSIVVNAGSFGTTSVTCEEGEKALSVSSANTGNAPAFGSFLPSPEVAVNASLTTATDPTGASASARNAGQTERTVTVGCLSEEVGLDRPVAMGGGGGARDRSSRALTLSCLRW